MRFVVRVVFIGIEEPIIKGYFVGNSIIDGIVLYKGFIIVSRS
jgi:hypothetical protein